jgi:hypothetical protein
VARKMQITEESQQVLKNQDSMSVTKFC